MVLTSFALRAAALAVVVCTMSADDGVSLVVLLALLMLLEPTPLLVDETEDRTISFDDDDEDVEFLDDVDDEQDDEDELFDVITSDDDEDKFESANESSFVFGWPPSPAAGTGD